MIIRPIYATSTQAYTTRSVTYEKSIVGPEVTPYMRETPVFFDVTGLMPNTRMHCFFGGVNVNEHCMPTAANAVKNVPIFSDAEGNVRGMFILPKDKFLAGEKVFRITNDENDSRDEDLLRTSAEATFASVGSEGKDRQGEEVNLESIRVINQVVVLPPPPPPRAIVVISKRVPVSPRILPRDPLAQTFTADENCYVTSVEVFFKSSTDDANLFIQIRSTENGYPSSKVLGEKLMKGKDVLKSEDASIATKITFPVPIFLEGTKEYCIVVGGDTPEAFLWVSKLGENDITDGMLIDQQPSLGSLFKSQNGTTWTASQNEDMKFNLYVARFKDTETKIVLKNQALVDENEVYNPFETEIDSNRVRVYSPNHGMVVGDTTSFNIGSQNLLTINVTLGTLNLGHTLTTDTGHGKIYEIEATQNAGEFTIKMKDMVGTFAEGQAFETDAFQPTTPNKYFAIQQLGISDVDLPATNVVIGTVGVSLLATHMNGIPLGELNSGVVVAEVDSIDTFIVETTTVATETGLGGGTVYLNCNKRYDSFHISGNYLAIGCDQEWKMTGLGHSQNGLFESLDYVTCPENTFKPGEEFFNKKPLKIATPTNETIQMGDTGTSITVTATFNAVSDYQSPILNLDTFSMTTSANTVDNYGPDTEADISVAPNAANQYIEETDPQDGIGTYKYTTRDIELKDPAFLIKILLEVYKPEYSDFDIYFKVQTPEDQKSLVDIDWVLIDNTWKSFTSVDFSDFREIEVDTEQYNSLPFGAFKIKVVGKTSNTSNPPSFKNLRVIAAT